MDTNNEASERFLAKTRYGYLTTLRRDGSPTAVPVWFEWDGEAVRVFTGKSSSKVKLIQRDPRITLLIPFVRLCCGQSECGRMRIEGINGRITTVSTIKSLLAYNEI